MTKPAHLQVEVRPQQHNVGPRPKLTFVSDFCHDLQNQLALLSTISWPSDKYKTDPVRFFEEILGVKPWHKQVEVLEAIRDNPRVAVRSGHKVSKSHTIGGSALWFYCSFEDARAVMTSTTARQVDDILWRELRMMLARSGRCVVCKLQDPDGRRIPAPCPHSAIIDGQLGGMARTGLKSDNFREVTGFTAREAEAVAGISGKNLIYFPDEASGIPALIFEAMEGNRAGGARMAMFGNPTKNEGEFYEAFHSKSELYKTITISSEETPNVVEGREVIPGLATREWIEEKKEEWGEESPIYSIRVKGKHAQKEEGKIFSIHDITQAEERLREMQAIHKVMNTAPDGRLFIGFDPAGDSGLGDETMYCPRRGMQQIMFRGYRGLGEEAHYTNLLELIYLLRRPSEIPVVVLDREGKVGYDLANYLRGKERENIERGDPLFQLVTVRSSDKAVRQPHLYDRVRDELAANLKAWLQAGGGIVEDAKLVKEMHTPEWIVRIDGRMKLMDKKQWRKIIGRSPDRFDALALSVWESPSVREEDGEGKKQAPPPVPPSNYDRQVIDPYSGAEAFQRRG